MISCSLYSANPLSTEPEPWGGLYSAPSGVISRRSAAVRELEATGRLPSPMNISPHQTYKVRMLY